MIIYQKDQLTPLGPEKLKTQPQAPRMCQSACSQPPPPALSQASMASNSDASVDSDPGHSTTLATCAKPRQERRTDHHSHGIRSEVAPSEDNQGRANGSVDLNAVKERQVEKRAKKKKDGSDTCLMGYAWIRQGGQHICEGGNHFKSV